MYDFTRIRAWQSAKVLFVDVYEITKTFPPEEQFGFVSQMRRAARSVCADIAEGAGYEGGLDSARFYRMGFGSSNEVYSDMHLTREVGILSLDGFNRLEQLIVPAQKELSKLIHPPGVIVFTQPSRFLHQVRPPPF